MVQTIQPFDNDFFYEEEKAGYLVTKERKEVWAIEIDLLMRLDAVCKKHNLKYCVGAGTMLGAVRHKGFIPWDDDIDVYMLREDYDKLLSVAGEFQYPYFLQNSYTEKNLLRAYTKLRNGLTTGTTRRDRYREMNHGIFIDIFPLDGIGTNSIIDHYQYILNRMQRGLFVCYNDSKARKHPMSAKGKSLLLIEKLAAKLFVRNKTKFFGRFEANLKRYSKKGTKMWGNRTLNFDCPRSRRPYEDWLDIVYLPFETIEVPVPRKYDEMLRQQYGDYMKIPEKKGLSMHGELYISTEYSFDDYRKKHSII